MQQKEDTKDQDTNDCTGEYTTEEIQDALAIGFFGLDNTTKSSIVL